MSRTHRSDTPHRRPGHRPSFDILEERALPSATFSFLHISGLQSSSSRAFSGWAVLRMFFQSRQSSGSSSGHTVVSRIESANTRHDSTGSQVSSNPEQSLSTLSDAETPIFESSNSVLSAKGNSHAGAASESKTHGVGSTPIIQAIASWANGSAIYGSDPEQTETLRSYSGGRLKSIQDSGPPTPGDSVLQLLSDRPLILAGLGSVGGTGPVADVGKRLTFRSLFIGEHNRIVAELSQSHPDWSDEQLYQQARQIVTAEIQAIIYHEFLPLLMGTEALRPVHSEGMIAPNEMAREFSTTSSRLTPSFLEGSGKLAGPDGNERRSPRALRDLFSYSPRGEDASDDPVLKYMATDNAPALDPRLVADLRNSLLDSSNRRTTPPAGREIARTLDHDLTAYNSTRSVYGLKRVNDYTQVRSDAQFQKELRELFGRKEQIDRSAAVQLEIRVSPMFGRIITDQFEQLQDGDGFWYERDLVGPSLAAVRNVRLGDVVRRNATILDLPRDGGPQSITSTDHRLLVSPKGSDGDATPPNPRSSDGSPYRALSPDGRGP